MKPDDHEAQRFGMHMGSTGRFPGPYSRRNRAGGSWQLLSILDHLLESNTPHFLTKQLDLWARKRLFEDDVVLDLDSPEHVATVASATGFS